MKLKYDFVTNSSSTSFCAWGIVIDGLENLSENIIEKIYESYAADCREEGKKPVSYAAFSSDPCEYEWLEYLDGLMQYTNLSVTQRGYDYEDDIYIGITPENKNVQDMTINQIKKLSLKELTEFGFEVEEIEYIQDGWFAG